MEKVNKGDTEPSEKIKLLRFYINRDIPESRIVWVSPT